MNTIKITQGHFTEATDFLFKELESTIKKYDVDNIVSNGNICSVIKESSSYKPVPKLTKNKKIYTLGKFKNMILNVDAMMLWTDNRIILRKSNTIVDEISIVDDNGILI